MPRNGTGQYSAPASTWNPGVNGVTATTADYNAQLTDIAAALTQSVSSDGQTPMTGNLPMGNNKVTGLANGSAVTDAAAFGQIGRYAGNCRLTKSGANLLLIPFNGNQLTINGVIQVVPSAGVTLTPTGTPSTLYYIYAFMTGAVMTLENSTTAYATDVVTGMPIKAGDPTRTLVGMARPIAGPAWQDAANQRFVVSWFNKRSIECKNAMTSNIANSGAVYTEITAAGLRTEFLMWAGDTAPHTFTGFLTNNSSGAFAATNYALDGTLVDGTSQVIIGSTTSPYPIACVSNVGAAAEGYHYMTLFARQSTTSTSNYAGNSVASDRCVNYGVIQG